MEKKRFRVGSITVLFAVVILCVAIFGALTVATAISDRRTAQRYGEYVEALYRCENAGQQWLSQAVMETLAVIAYRQPVTKAEIELIRGVKCDYSVQMLVSRGLIEEVGRKEALGRPILYGTTDAFLRHFCLTSLADLPEIDFSALADRIAEAEAKQAAEKPKADPVDKLAQNIASEAAEE